ncbi:hypothetical protein DMENIID0001_035750 [Sergentomyia squamirostris]
MDTATYDRRRGRLRQGAQGLRQDKSEMQLHYLKMERGVNQFLEAVKSSERPEEEKRDTLQKMNKFLERNKKYDL